VKRADAGHSASLVNTLLTEIDGAASRNENVLVMGATNTPWRLDSAFRRPGRFDHVVFVPPPDQAARKSIFALALDGIPQESLDLDQLAQKSEKFSGADIRAVVEASTESVIETIIKTGKEVKLTQKELLQALKKHRPTTLEWLEQASNYASYANQSGLYDELSEYIRSI
jgi:SpoVK/Ycf46/Vps4 family AAA+-type ATPase